MPTISLTGDPHGDRAWFQAVMSEPSDERMRNAIAASLVVRAQELDIGPDYEAVEVPRNVLRVLLNGPGDAERHRHLEQSAKQGIIAGWIFVMMFVVDRYPSQLGRRAAASKPSLNKALAAVKWFADTGAVFADGTPIPKETSIRQAWERFRPVAHLWAALSWNVAWPTLNRAGLFAEGFETTIAAAHYFQKFGVSFRLDTRSGTGSSSLIDPVAAWTLDPSQPARIALPDDPSVFESSPLAQALKSYSAAQK